MTKRSDKVTLPPPVMYGIQPRFWQCWVQAGRLDGSASVSPAAPGHNLTPKKQAKASGPDALGRPLRAGRVSAGQADVMSSVHLETTDPPSWVPSGSSF